MYTYISNGSSPNIRETLTSLEIECMLLLNRLEVPAMYTSKPYSIEFVINQDIAFYALRTRGVDRLLENHQALSMYGLRVRGPIVVVSKSHV